MTRCFAILPLLLAGCGALANTRVQYKLKNGETLEGTLLQSEDGQSLVQLKYGAVTLTAGDVAAVEALGASPLPPPSGRLASLARALPLLVQEPWGSALMQVPATVVGAGTLRNVPYASMRAGNFEFNVYGDPDAPAGLEVGVYGQVHSGVARRLCAAALKRVLHDPADQAMLDVLPWEGGRKERAGVVFEVTPPTAADAFGGWWITVYDAAALERQRASDAELARITMPRGEIKPSGGVTAWKPHELRLSRPEERGPVEQGRVYIRGVHRKNGVYVVPKSV